MRLWFVLLLLIPGLARAQSLIVTDGARMSFGLGTMWVWQGEDGSVGVRGVIPKLLEQERVVVVVQGRKGKGKKKQKVAEVGSIRRPVEISGSFDGGLPLQVRLNYTKGDRIQTARRHRVFLVDELPESGVAVLLTFRLVGEERVEGTRGLMGCEGLLTSLQLGEGDGCKLPG